MSALIKVLLYLAAVLGVAVVLSPPIYWTCQWLVGQGYLELIRGFPFHRFFTRTLQVSAIVLLIPLFFSLGIRRLSELGLERDPRRLRNWAGGFFSGLLPVVVFAAVVLWLGIYDPRKAASPEKLIQIAGTALAVGAIEEFLFRGVLLGLLVRAMGKFGGLVLSSLLFAVVHFLRPARNPDSGPVTWTSGWEQLLSFTTNLPPPELLAAGMLTLFIAGVVLGLLTFRTSALWAAAGMHTGWIFVQQSLNHFAVFRPDAPGAGLPWIGPSLVSGVVPTGAAAVAVLLAGLLLSWKWVRRG